MTARPTIAALRAFHSAFRAKARQLCTLRIAREWMEMLPQITPAEAAEWANLGFLPEEALPLVNSNHTAADVRAAEQVAELVAGGPEELAAQRLAEMIELGVLVDPARVVMVEDPFDPTCAIIAVRPA